MSSESIRPTKASCQTCKLRRIKCDGGRPTCAKCKKSQRLCVEPSRAHQASLQVHLENQYASGEVKRPRGPRSKLTFHPIADLPTRALAYYEKYHVQPEGQGLPAGLSHCVHAWKASARRSELVDLALSAMALAVYSRTQQDVVAATEACSTYDHLLPLVHKRLTDVSTLQQQDIDSTLLAIFLMGRYEGVMHNHALIPQQPTRVPAQAWFHHDGVMALLKVWYASFRHNPATAIVKHTRRGSIRSSLLRNRALPGWLSDGEQYGEQGLDLEDDRIRVGTVSLRCALAKLCTPDAFAAEAETVDLEAQKLDQALQEWAAKSLGTYQLHTMSALQSFPTKHFYASTVYSYDTLGSAASCAQYFATRMILNSTRLKARSQAIELTREAGFGALLCDRAQQECSRSLGAMANSLAFTVPFCLERFKAPQSPGCRPLFEPNEGVRPWLAGLLVWPLTIASSIEYLDDTMLLWFRSELVEIGKIIGDGVLQDAESDRWLKA